MDKPTVFLVNPRDKACGVAQMGLNMAKCLAHSEKYNFVSREPVTALEYRMLLDEYQPVFVLWNYYPCVMPWVNLDTLNIARERGLKQATIFHEVPITGFDAYLYSDPTFECKQVNLSSWYSIPRPIHSVRPYDNRPIDYENPIIGGSGFGFENKGYVRLVERVKEEFKTATIRLHMPFAKWGDDKGERALRMAEWCREAAKGSGIKLEFSHDFLEPEAFIDWLASNDLNAFLYDEMPGRGIASTTDYALMANRPIAITKTTMFRHLHYLEPSICVEERSLIQIMMDWRVCPICEALSENSTRDFCDAVENIVETFLWKPKRANLLLRENQGLDIWEEAFFDISPEMMSRKIPEANKQQFWMVSMFSEMGGYGRVHEKSLYDGSALCVGCFEDTAFEYLKSEGVNVTGIDPQVNGMDLHKFAKNNVGAQFDCVFATSVLEHVQNDEQFIADMCRLLKPDGVGLLTCDFREGWHAGDPVPYSDFRLYTAADIARLGKVLHANGCYWVDKPDTSGEPDFHYQGHNYSFMALAFKKL